MHHYVIRKVRAFTATRFCCPPSGTVSNRSSTVQYCILPIDHQLSAPLTGFSDRALCQTVRESDINRMSANAFYGPTVLLQLTRFPWSLACSVPLQIFYHLSVMHAEAYFAWIIGHMLLTSAHIRYVKVRYRYASTAANCMSCSPCLLHIEVLPMHSMCYCTVTVAHSRQIVVSSFAHLVPRAFTSWAELVKRKWLFLNTKTLDSASPQVVRY